MQPVNALDYLLAVDDVSRVGTLRFRDEDGVFQRAQEEGRRTAPPLIELGHLLSASRAVDANKETAADLAYLRGRGTSLGGMRPKCTDIDDDGALSVGKFPSITDERAVTKGEVLALTLAKNAGINAAAARIVDSEGLPVALIRRFDRRGSSAPVPASARRCISDPGTTRRWQDLKIEKDIPSDGSGRRVRLKPGSTSRTSNFNVPAVWASTTMRACSRTRP